MAKFLKNLGITLLVLGIIGSIMLASSFTTNGGFSFSVFLVSALSVVIFCTLIYAAGAALETLESIRDSVSMIHKKMDNQGKDSAAHSFSSSAGAIHVENKNEDSDNEDSSTLWKCKNCGTLNPRNYEYCYQCKQHHS